MTRIQKTKRERKDKPLKWECREIVRVREEKRNKYDKYPHSDITQKIIGCAIDVHKNLGPGFKESAYENALLVELGNRAVQYERQEPVTIIYKGRKVGRYRMDLVVEGKIVVELKAVKSINNEDRRRLLSYLKATGKKVGLLINFAKPTIEVNRLVL
jgi:GxxExxY protein